MGALTRATITVASKRMLPAYPIVLGWIGLAYLFGDPERTNTPTLEAVKRLMPIQAWGATSLIIAMLMVIGYMRRSREVTIFVLYMAATAFGIWSICFAWAIFAVPNASLIGPAYPALAAVACTASARSVATQERS